MPLRQLKLRNALSVHSCLGISKRPFMSRNKEVQIRFISELNEKDHWIEVPMDWGTND